MHRVQVNACLKKTECKIRFVETQTAKQSKVYCNVYVHNIKNNATEVRPNLLFVIVAVLGVYFLTFF